MKGYKYLNDLEAGKFIEKYEVSGDKIILYMYNGDKLEYQYSEEALNKVDEIQEETYELYNKKELHKNYKKQIMNKTLLTIFGDSAIALLIAMAIYGPVVIISALISGVSILFIIQMIKCAQTAKRIDELEKQKLYMVIKDELDGEILKHQNICQCLTNRKRNAMLKQEKLTSSAFNLTSIDELSLKDLKKLRDNVIREKELGFEANDVIGSKKNKTIIKSYVTK